MKRLLYICSFAVMIGNTSCEDFLDKSPDMGLTSSDVYKDYASIRGYLDESYRYLDNYFKFDGTRNQRSHNGALSDEFASLYNGSPTIAVNNGNWLGKTIDGYEIGISGKQGGSSIWKAYKGIRIVNRIIRDIDLVPGLTEVQRNEILGQAHFYRAWWYFQLIKRYGGMPKLDQLFAGDGSEDLPRMTYHESHDWMMTDIDNAITMLPDAWDLDNTGRPNKIAAMAFKSMAQLYDASPLMQNDLTSIEVKGYDQERAKLAAQSAYAVIDYVEKHPELGYGLMSGGEQYKNIFYWQAPPYMQPEYLWYNRSQDDQGGDNYKRYIRSFWLPAELASGTGEDAVMYNAPTQNMVDMFEKRGVDGKFYPITDERAAYKLETFSESRDPRFYNNILCPGDEWGVDKQGTKQYITTYVGGAMYTSLLGSNHSNKRAQTGYVCKKFLWPEANQWTNGYNMYRTITVYIRLAQVYLDFAEAAFEATGSATATVPECGNLTAKDALNIVRKRAGITDVVDDIVNNPEKFREAYRRERAVELMFENNRWWDIRRWMIAHELFKDQFPIKGIEATKDGDKYTYKIVDVEPERRVFDMRNYWYPFAMDDVDGLNNLVQNPGW